MTDDAKNAAGRLWTAKSRARLHLLLVIVLGLLASAAAYGLGRNFETTRLRASFERDAGERIAAVQASISSTTGSLRALASFFEATDAVTSEQFARFVGPLLAAYPGVQAYEWIPRVDDGDRGRVESAAGRIFPGFQFSERDTAGSMVRAGDRPFYYPVYFVEPLSGNKAAVGFNLFSDPTRRAAIEAAVKSSSPQATGRVTLVQETGNQYGFLVFVPVFESGRGGGDALRGLALGVFRVGDVVERAAGRPGRGDGIDIRIWDRSAPPAESLLYPKKGPGRGRTVHDISTSRELNVGGRRWEVVASATPDYLAREGGLLPFAFAVAAMLVTANIAWILHRRFMFEHEVVARTAEMRIARDEARDAVRAKSTFLATMSHEIRTPMNAIIAMTDHLLDGNPQADQREPLQIISKSSEHLLHVINDILDLSKLEARRIQFEMRTIPVEKTVRSVVDMLSGAAREKGIEIRTGIAADVPRSVAGDPARLRQILLNLGSNAVKFTEAGTVDISVAAGDPRADGGVTLAITVSDTGIGMADTAQLFAEFWQADSSISRRYGGTGLGLAITKRLVDQMGGTIAVRSAPGRGSEFTVVIPFGRASAAAEAPKDASSRKDADAGRFRGLEILLVEDNLTNREIAKKIIRRLGAEVDVANDGIEAVEAASRRRYDVVLMDVHMPRMDGLEAARAIRNAAEPFCEVPIVALTASAFADDRERCFAAGMNDFCAKPYRSRELADAIGRATARRTQDAA